MVLISCLEAGFVKTVRKTKLEIVREATSPLSPGLDAEGTYETSILM